MTRDQVVQQWILYATKRRLIERGWGPGPGRCLVMAIEDVTPHAIWYSASAPQRVVMDALREVVGEKRLVEWNDRQEHVTAIFTALDAAAELLHQRMVFGSYIAHFSTEAT